MTQYVSLLNSVLRGEVQYMNGTMVPKYNGHLQRLNPSRHCEKEQCDSL